MVKRGVQELFQTQGGEFAEIVEDEIVRIEIPKLLVLLAEDQDVFLEALTNDPSRTLRVLAVAAHLVWNRRDVWR